MSSAKDPEKETTDSQANVLEELLMKEVFLSGRRRRSVLEDLSCSCLNTKALLII
jgi:hypothetical protein